MTRTANADIIREYGPFPGVESVAGVTFDGEKAWFASGARLNALDPGSGAVVQSIEVAAAAGTAFDGTSLYQLSDDRIQKLDPATGEVTATIPAPEGGGSGMAWAEGSLWVGQYRGQKIFQVDPATGAILRTIESDRFVTGVSWTNGELWHGASDGEASALRRVDPASGEVHEELTMPAGAFVSGLEADGQGRFYAGGGPSGMVRLVKRAG